MPKKKNILSKLIPQSPVKKEPEHKCKSCLLYNRKEGICNVAIMIQGEKFNMPVSPDDFCHMEELDIPVEQVRFWAEDPETGKMTDGHGVIKVEYPANSPLSVANINSPLSVANIKSPLGDLNVKL